MSTLSIDPNESIYLDMYRWGLKQIPIEDIERECSRVGKAIRKKDYENYDRGFNKSNGRNDPKSVLRIQHQVKGVLDKSLSEFKLNTNKYEGIRWVPCNENNKPLIKWTQHTLNLNQLIEYFKEHSDCFYRAEQLSGNYFIVIDIDADHGNKVDKDTAKFFSKYRDVTHCLTKESYDGVPLSYHLTWYTNRIIPTVHVKEAHVDILGNAGNQLRYWKNKVSNNRNPAILTDEIWDDIRTYLKGRKVIKQ